MAGFIESSIELNFPDTNYFRFANCRGYSILSGNNFKEMDACWFDVQNNSYWLLELKDFSSASLTTNETIEKKSWELVKKSVDSLCMFLSSIHGYPYAVNLNPCFPIPLPNSTTQFNFINIIHCDTSQKPDIQLINEKYKTKFKPYAQLFGITKYSVVEHSIAKRIIPNNIIR